jgi:hypothetical protein
MFPPTTDAGDTVIATSTAGVMVRLVDREVEPVEPVMATVVVAETGLVVIGNETVFAEAGTVTVAGTEALLLPEVNVTTAPEEDANPLRVIVPVEATPPRTEGVPVMVTGVEAFTGTVVMLNAAVVAPGAMVTVAGIVTFELLEERLTTTLA